MYSIPSLNPPRRLRLNGRKIACLPVVFVSDVNCDLRLWHLVNNIGLDTMILFTKGKELTILVN